MAHVYVTGHRSPDLDSVAAAIGYAELKGRLQPQDTFTPVRLGPVNPQTAWALERSGAPEPEFLPHIHLRVRDVMREPALVAHTQDPLREVGIGMARTGLDLVPVVDEDGTLVGMMTEGDLARLYIRDSVDPPSFGDTPVHVGSIVRVLGARLLTGEADLHITGRMWVITMDTGTMGRTMGEGDIVVVGDRVDAQRRAVELGVAAVVVTNGAEPTADVVALAAERGVVVIASPLDSYVTSRMIRISVPVGTIMGSDPLTVTPEDLLADVTPQIIDVDYRAAVAVDDDRVPIAMVTRSDLVQAEPRQVLLVDHAEQAQSVPGVEEANIVEILDHHHIGSIETRVPVRATFDPVGSTATLVVERFRAEGREPRGPTAVMLLAAVLSDTVILSSPTTTDRDHRVVGYLEELTGLDARGFGMEMFEASSNVGELSADEIVARDVKEYDVDGGDRQIAIAQIETVGAALEDRRSELLAALERRREQRRYALAALMITDIVSRGTKLLVSGETLPVERSFGPGADACIDLPGVMSRKKQVAPRLLAAF